MSVELNEAHSLIRVIPDYPAPGILFQDLTPLFSNGRAFSIVIDALKPIPGSCDVVVGIEARGFILGAAIANALSIGFVPIRKQGKLPFSTHEESYGLEYGEDVIQIHQDAFTNGTRVWLVDDVLATGGTATAALRLVEKLGGIVVGFACLMEIVGLPGRAALEASHPELQINVLFKS
jgi:adenine phosphoribosyltransferase